MGKRLNLMKFATDQDAKLFLIEIERLDLVDSATKEFFPDEEMMSEFIKKRRTLIPGLKDFRRRQNTRQQWRHERYKMLKGIRRFHKSTAGKKFHRALGRFIATRESLSECSHKIFYLSEIADILKSISSLKTHANIELEFYHPLSEELEYRLLFEELIPILDSIEKKLLSGDFTLEETEQEIMLRIIDENQIKKHLAEKFKIQYETVDAMHRQILNQKPLCEMNEEDGLYYTKVFEILNTRLKKVVTKTDEPNKSLDQKPVQ